MDTNLDGVYNNNEQVLYGAAAGVSGKGAKQQVDGTLKASSLEAYQEYAVDINPTSIPDPGLVPATGWLFRFIADPGRNKIMDIPMQPQPLLQGYITGWDGAMEVLEVEVVTEGHPPMRLASYCDNTAAVGGCWGR